MAEMTHLVVAKFKQDVLVDDIIKGMEDLVSHVDLVSSFQWGADTKGDDSLRQGFTHAFIMTFGNPEDFAAFLDHPKHAEFSATFSAAVDKVLLLDFPAVRVKPGVAISINDIADEGGDQKAAAGDVAAPPAAA